MANTNDVIVTIKLAGQDKFKSDVNNAFGSLKKGNDKLVSGFKEIGKAALVAGTVVAGAFVAMAKNGIQVAADLETARVGFTTLLGSAKKAADTIDMIKKDAASTPFEIAGLIQANQMLTQVTKDSKRSERVLLNVGKALSAAGKGSEELDRIIVNLQQIGNTGKITELDIRQFGYAGINILELLADYYGTTKLRASDMLKSSKNAFKDLEGAFQKAGEGGGKFSKAFSNQMGTFNQQMSNLKDSWNIFTADFVVGTGLFDIAKQAIDGLTRFINDNKSTFIEWGKQVKETVTPKLKDLGDKAIKFVDNVRKLDGPTVSAWAKLFGLLASVSIATSIISNINPISLLFASLAFNAGMAYTNTRKLMDLLAVYKENKDIQKTIDRIKRETAEKHGGVPTPVPIPKKANGGIIGGSSLYGDRVLTRTNSGEMVLTKGQQGVLFSLLKRMAGGNSVNINAPINFGTQAGQMQQQNTFTNMLRNLAT